LRRRGDTRQGCGEAYSACHAAGAEQSKAPRGGRGGVGHRLAGVSDRRAAVKYRQSRQPVKAPGWTA
jgi:hypothetical protein